MMDNHSERPEVKHAALGKTGTSVRYSQTIKAELIYVAKQIVRESHVFCIIRASVPLTFLGQTLQAYKNRFLIAGLLITLMVVFISLLASRKISKPLEMMLQGVERFTAGDLSVRVKKAGSLEMTRLTEALNQMALRTG